LHSERVITRAGLAGKSNYSRRFLAPGRLRSAVQDVRMELVGLRGHGAPETVRYAVHRSEKMLVDFLIHDKFVRKAGGGRRPKVIREIPANSLRGTPRGPFGARPASVNQACQRAPALGPARNERGRPSFFNDRNLGTGVPVSRINRHQTLRWNAAKGHWRNWAAPTRGGLLREGRGRAERTPQFRADGDTHLLVRPRGLGR